ncbi:hypothetical protein D3C73_1356390 [compost metagenome]
MAAGKSNSPEHLVGQPQIGIQEPQPNERNRDNRHDGRQIEDRPEDGFSLDVPVQKDGQQKGIDNAGWHTEHYKVQSNPKRFVKILVFPAEHSGVIVQTDKGG